MVSGLLLSALFLAVFYCLVHQIYSHEAEELDLTTNLKQFELKILERNCGDFGDIVRKKLMVSDD